MKKAFDRCSVRDHSAQAPDRIEADGARTWITRGANFVIAITRVRKDTRLCVTTPDESMALFYETSARVKIGGGETPAPAHALAIVPPGASEIVSDGEGHIVRFLSARATDFLEQAGNAGAYVAPRENVAPLRDWPAPPDGFRLRLHDLSQGLAEGEKTRVYRCSNLMINVLRERDEPRDMREMSPHFHDDFEQASVTLSGVHVHHVRTPWGADMSAWRADEAIEVGSPSVTVIPPPLIHTTRNVGAGRALLIDLFSPPRADFSLRPGMVRNASEYPLPPDLRS